ncbi:hypothetical protein F2981_02315 [Sinorhizobium meliloti]|nr:hypothetical protein [Sinorhizobium meliloti]
MMEDELLKRRTQLARPDVSIERGAGDPRPTLRPFRRSYGTRQPQDRNYPASDTSEGRFVLKIARAEYAGPRSKPRMPLCGMSPPGPMLPKCPK